MYINVAEIRQVLCYICIANMPKTHSQTGLKVLCCINTTDIILTQFKCVKNKAKVGGGVARSWGVGKKSHTHTYIHIHLEKFFQILAFFLKSRGVALFVCVMCVVCALNPPHYRRCTPHRDIQLHYILSSLELQHQLSYNLYYGKRRYINRTTRAVLLRVH
jgi:hypothetical protein